MPPIGTPCGNGPNHLVCLNDERISDALIRLLVDRRSTITAVADGRCRSMSNDRAGVPRRAQNGNSVRMGCCPNPRLSLQLQAASAAHTDGTICRARRSLGPARYAGPGKAVRQAMTCEPGDPPASGRSCFGPGDGHGTVFRLSDEDAVENASARLAGCASRSAPGLCGREMTIGV